MTEGHESEEPPFLVSGKAIRYTQTVGNNCLSDIVHSQNDTFGVA